MWARPSGLRTFEATFAFTFITARRLVVFPRETLSIGFRVLVSRHPAIQTTGLLTFAPAGLSPAEHASLRWTHTRTCGFPASGSSRKSFARVGVEDAVRDLPVEKRTEVMMSPPSSSPVRLSVVVSWTGSRSPRSPPVFPGNGSHPVAPPSLARVPVSPVPRGQRYYEGATTSRPRIPGRLSVSLPGSARSSAFRARLGGAPGWLEDPAGPGHLVSRPPICRHTLTRTQAGSHRLPGDPSHAFAPVQDPGRTDDPHPDGVVDAAPAQPTAKAPAIEISRLLTRLRHLLPTLHDGRRRTPCKARFRLVG